MSLNDLERILDLEIWDGLSFAACEEVARRLVTDLPSSFRFKQVNTYESGAQRHRIALFEWNKGSFQEDFLWGERDGRKQEENHGWEKEWDEEEALRWEYPSTDAGLFALIPGGHTTLGYDSTMTPLVFAQDLVDEWQKHAGCLLGEGLPGDQPSTYQTLSTYLAHSTQSSGEITAYNVLTVYLEHSMLPLREATIQPFLLEVIAQEETSESLPHAQLTSALAYQGFRLPSMDEWEYACAAGSRTIFSWGNDIPEEISSLRVPFTPNAFGLFIANHCYHWEYCADPTVLKGGDGGYAACGGSGKLAEFLPLASAYILKLSESEQRKGMLGARVRRAYSLF